MTPNRVRSFLILTGINLVLFVVGVVVIELTFGRWFAEYFPPYGAVVDRTFTYQQRLYEPGGLVTYSRDQFGLRGVRESVNEIELVTIGGSTTDQRYISDGETWQDVIRGLTGIRVANAGVDGLSSSGHVVAIADWLHRVPNLRPCCYLHYLGVNDALYIHYAVKEPSNVGKIRALLERQVQNRPLGRTLRARSALIQTWLRTTAWLKGTPIVGDMQSPPD